MHVIVKSPNRNPMILNQLSLGQIYRVLLKPVQRVHAGKVGRFMGNNQVRSDGNRFLDYIHCRHKCCDDSGDFHACMTAREHIAGHLQLAASAAI
ncbi:hypothetical protein D3C75_1072640 [compost metagenome]